MMRGKDRILTNITIINGLISIKIVAKITIINCFKVLPKKRTNKRIKTIGFLNLFQYQTAPKDPCMRREEYPLR